MMHARRLFMLLTIAASVAASAQVPPSKERGFKPDLVYQFHEFDNVALFNGNLTAAIPLGPTYPVGAGLSYSFALRYSGNLWKNAEDCRYVNRPVPDDPCINIMLGLPENGGLGWRLSFGDLREPLATSIPGTALSGWAYVSPDGSEHLFWPTLHNTCGGTVTSNCENATPGVSYSRDGSYLRMREYTGYIVVEFPDGERRRFEEYPDDDWRLRYIYTAFSPLDNSGVPTSNYISIAYVPSGVAGLDDTWVVADSHGREHKVKFRESPLASEQYDLVDSVEVEAFRSGGPSRVAATYSFDYEILDATTGYLAKPCAGNTTATTSAALLSTVDLPSGESWSFTYDKPSAAASCDQKLFSGTMRSATLPTGGKIEWTYQPYIFSVEMPPAVGVKTRTVEADGADVEYTTYMSALGMTTVTRYAKWNGEWRAESKTEHAHVWENTVDFGLPYDRNGTLDGDGMRISAETYDCDPATGTCSKVRQKRLQYEWDYLAGCNPDHPCLQNRNRRQRSEKTVFVDDGDREALVHYSDFDGLGHYRMSRTGGNFSSGNVRTSFVGYNEAVGTYQLGTNGIPLSGFTPPSSTAPWTLGTYKAAYDTEGSQTARVEACFDTATGFLLRKRTMKGQTTDEADLLAVFTPDAAGFVQTEEYFGGGKHKIDPDSADTCTFAPAHDGQFTYRIDHNYEYGSLKTSQYAGASFSSANYIVDRGTGLIYRSADTAGKWTTFGYDSSARLTSVAPPDMLSTTYTYMNASGSAKAKVTSETGTGTARVAAEFEYDALGRLWREKKLMPGGLWSIRETLYDALGRRVSVSEPGFGAPSAAKTIYDAYDAFGRPGTITAPDGSVATYAYEGGRRTKRTQTIATSETAETSVAVTEELDRQGRLVAVVEDADGSSPVTTTYSYDAGNRLTQVSVAGSQNRSFTYDGRGLLLSEQHPESQTTSYEYDARGKVVTRTTPVSTLTFLYDRAERLREVKENDVIWKEFVYDSAQGAGAGKMASATRHNRNTVLGADVTVRENYVYFGRGGRLSAKETVASTGEAFTDTYSYDAFGNLESLGYPSCPSCSIAPPGRTVTNRYENGLLSEVFGYTSATNKIGYHPNGMLAEVRHVNANGADGPLYRQAMDSGMARPGSITVTNFCDDFAITVQPQDGTVNSGQPVNLTVTAPGATSYEWFQGDVRVSTEQTLTQTVTQASTFWVRVGNGVCTIDSRKATVSVTACPAPDASITAPGGVAASALATATVPATAGSTYAWSITGGTITGGARTNSITFRAGCSGTVTLGVNVTAACGTSSAAWRSVSLSSVSVTMDDPDAVAQGNSATLRAALVGTGSWTVAWSDGHTESNVTAASVSHSVSPSGTTAYTVTATDGYGCSASDTAVVTVIPPAPYAFEAIAVSTTEVKLSWQYSGIADEFQVYRNGSRLITDTITAREFRDVSATPATAYVYEVRAVKSGTASTMNPRDLATTVLFDSIAQYATKPAAVHVSKLRDAVNAVRRLAVSGDYSFSPDMASNLPVKALHIQELRTVLAAARSALQLPAVSYTYAVASNGVIHAADITELQGGVK